MKKVSIVLVILVLVCSLSAKIKQLTSRKTPIELSNQSSEQATVQAYREAPDYEFVTDPTDILSNYYDYMPGSYNGLPVQVQSDEFGGVYLVFHSRIAELATRRVYFAYVDEYGDVTYVDQIGTQDLHEGYANIDIDPVSGCTFAVWHADYTLTPGLEIVVSNNLFHQGLPFEWTIPFSVINSSVQTTNPEDEFLWPNVHIGHSPEEGKRRIYITAKNSYGIIEPSGNPLIAFADFETSELYSMSILDWNYVTIPIFNNWSQNNIRPTHSFDVSSVDGRIAFFGCSSADSIYVCYNDNYGEGDWTINSELMHEDIVYLPPNPPGEYYWSFIFSGHMNSIFSEGSDKINFSGSFGMQYDDGTGNSYYYPKFIFPYTFQYNFEAEEFSYIIQAPQINENAANPNYVWQQNEIYLPWDTDNDGEVDEYDQNGDPVMFEGWPIYYWNNDDAFHENNMKMTTLNNGTHNWLVNIWQNGLKSKWYNDYGDENYIDWAEIAEIYITVSNDGGENWSDPIIMNAKLYDDNYCEEFAGMKPCYIYPGDKIEDLGDGWGLVHLMFLDDYSFGSFIHGNGEDLGGMMEYATMKIQFDSNYSAENNELPITNYELQNYPNPFNPTTTISFELTAKDTKNAKIQIYNLKGQKVKQLEIGNLKLGINSVIWDGTDQTNKLVSSGVYFYQLRFGDEVLASKKCLLLK